jgi:holliday junction DNA helicase RuvB
MSAPFDRSLTGEVDGGIGQDAPVSPLAGDEERVVESALRPHSLTEFIGQPKVSRQLALVLEGASAAGGRRTTCCSPDRRGWARPASR